MNVAPLASEEIPLRESPALEKKLQTMSHVNSYDQLEKCDSESKLIYEPDKRENLNYSEREAIPSNCPEQGELEGGRKSS